MRKSRVLPNFLWVGMEKAASTWIYDCLQEHPEVFLPPHRSEVHFFDRNYHKGIDFYKSFYKKHRHQKAAGDITPSYIQEPKIASLIASHLPHAKILICLRNPVDRLFSDYLHLARIGQIDLTFDEYSQHPQHLYKSLYYPKVKKYFELFPEDQILIVLFEKIKNNEIKFLQKIYRFLEVDEHFIPQNIYNQSNRYVNPRNIRYYRKVMGLLTSLRHRHNRIIDFFIESIKKTGLKKVLVKEESPPEMDWQKRKTLSEFFKEDVKKLSQLTRINFHQYWNN